MLPLYAGAIALLWLARPTPLSLAVGSLLIAGGLALRLWATGYLVKTARLTMGGPYAHVRHPLYLGSLLVGLGFGTMGGAWTLLVLVAAVPLFLFYYLPYKERIEGARLERLYGESYAAYRSAVPGFLPSLGAWRAAAGNVVDTVQWSFARVQDNDELGTTLGVLVGVAVLCLRRALPF